MSAIRGVGSSGWSKSNHIHCRKTRLQRTLDSQESRQNFSRRRRWFNHAAFPFFIADRRFSSNKFVVITSGREVSEHFPRTIAQLSGVSKLFQPGRNWLIHHVSLHNDTSTDSAFEATRDTQRSIGVRERTHQQLTSHFRDFQTRSTETIKSSGRHVYCTASGSTNNIRRSPARDSPTSAGARSSNRSISSTALEISSRCGDGASIQSVANASKANGFHWTENITAPSNGPGLPPLCTTGDRFQFGAAPPQ